MEISSTKSHLPSRNSVLIFVMYALFASTFTISKKALEICDPCFFIGTRMATAGLIFTVFALYQDKTALSRLRRQQWQCLLLMAFLAVYLTNILEFWSLHQLPSTTICFYYSLSPFCAAAISWMRLRETVSKKQLAGIVIGVLGFFCPFIFFHDSPTAPCLGLPELAMLIAVVSSVMGWVLLKELIEVHKINLFLANGITMFLGGVLALLHSAVKESWHPLPVINMPLFLCCQILMIIISNGMCYSLYGYLVNFHSSTRLSFCGLITPLFSSAFGYFLLNEPMTISFAIALPLVFIGLFVFNQDELSREFKSENQPNHQNIG